MISQKVSNVKIAEELVKEIPTKNAIQGILKKEVESCSNFLETIVPAPYHAFMHAAHLRGFLFILTIMLNCYGKNSLILKENRK